MNILFNNNNQASVSDEVSLNKVTTRIFNSVTVDDHVSTSNNDVSIPIKIKDVDIPKKVNVNIPQNKNVNIPFNNNNQTSVPDEVLAR